ncbi:hypothetical protein TKK_0003308 [Trichogramma kaykai]
MESGENIIGVKEEPNDNWSDAGDDYDFDSVDSFEAKNIQMFPLYESPANHANEVMQFQEKLNEKIFIDFECKDVKPDLKPMSTNICQSELKIIQPIIKLEKENQTDQINENIYIEFECKNVKSELKLLSENVCKTED